MPWIIPVIFFLILLYIFWWFQSIRRKETEVSGRDMIQQALEVFNNSLFKRRRMFPGMIFSGTPPATQNSDGIFPARTPVPPKKDHPETINSPLQNPTAPEETPEEAWQEEPATRLTEVPETKPADEPEEDDHTNS